MSTAEWEAVLRRINALRDAKNLTLREISEDSGIPVATISKWLRGDAVPPADKLSLLADGLGTTVSYLMGEGGGRRIPILGRVKCGPDGVLREEWDEYVFADIPNPDKHFFLRAEGNSMEPRILDGDLVLIREQDDVESGEIAVVLYPDEFEQMQTLKKIIKRKGMTILQPLNPTVEAMSFYGEEQNSLRIVGKAVEVYGRL